MTLFTWYRNTPLVITREELIPGLSFWVVEPVGHFIERVSGGARIPHRLPVRAGSELGDPLTRVVADLDSMELAA